MNLTSNLFLFLIILLYSCQDIKQKRHPKNVSDKNLAANGNVYTPPIVDSELLKNWNRFKTIVRTKNYEELVNASFEKVVACHDTMNVETLFKTCFFNVFDTAIVKKMVDTSFTDYNNLEIMREYLPDYVRDKVDVHGDSFEINQFQILKELTLDGQWTITFDFIKTKNGYKFFGCDSYGGPSCCR